ncbi:hypothetical protein L6R46_29985, partial [Myxococcota bacterium]|nr:hypothetical protein [Myxococcota bacterium]
DDTNLDLMATQEVDEHTSEVALPAPGGGKRPHRANDELVNHTMVPEDEETMLLPPVSFLGEEPPKKKNLAQRGTRNLAAAPAGKTTSAKPAATKPAAAKPAAAPAASKPMKPWLVALLVIFAILFTGIGVLISELIRR